MEPTQVGTQFRGFKYQAVFSEKEFRKLLEDLNCKDGGYEFLSPGSLGCVWTLEHNSTGSIFCIVSMRSKKRTPDNIDTAIHEAVHVWQHFSTHIGEDNKNEYEAYLISTIASSIIKELK